MRTSFDIDALIYKKLSGDAALKAALSGGIYTNQRPFDSKKEDVFISTLAITRQYVPQSARSVVNIYVPDLAVKISGKEQRQPNNARLSKLTNDILAILEEVNESGVCFYVSNQRTVKEEDNSEHFVNLRIDWMLLS